MPQDPYGCALTTSAAAADAYSDGLRAVLRLERGAVDRLATSVVLDPTFAMGHAALALLGHEMCAPVDIAARLAAAELHGRRSSERERSHVHAVVRHVRHGDSQPLLRHLETWPTDALLLSTAVPTIAFAGVSEVPQDAWRVVERAAPSYGDDWWFSGLLAFVRQEQGRFDEAMSLSCAALEVEPAAGHAAHARAHAHYETGDHRAGLAWMDSWVRGPGARIDSLSHFSWHAALHELSLGDTAAVRRRYDESLRPEHGLGCRGLVDSGSLLIRWALSEGPCGVPPLGDVARVAGREGLERPATPFLAMHAGATLLALGDTDGLRRLVIWAREHRHPTMRDVVAPLASALLLIDAGCPGAGADALTALAGTTWRLGGSDAQRELLEEIRIASYLRAGRYDDARTLLDRRLDRRHSPRDAAWRTSTRQELATGSTA